MYTTMLGLPVIGVDYIQPGIHQVEAINFRGTCYQPGFIQVDQLSPEHTEITKVGSQPHLMQSVGNNDG